MSTVSTTPTPCADFTHADVIIVGAGLGGLATAARLAEDGQRVIVCERGAELGGRARTRTTEGFALNLGAHALYAQGPAMELLRELGIEPRGAQPSGRGVLVSGDREHALPATPLSTIRTSALDLRSKFGLLRFFAQLRQLDVEQLRELSCAAWLDRQLAGAPLRELVAGIIRLTTYCGGLDTLSADAAVEQLRAAFGGVLYLDGGWIQLVDALAQRCRDGGVELRLGARVGALGRADRARWAVEVDGHALTCDHVVVASSPQLADSLLGPVLGHPGPGSLSEATRRCSAATLDLGLRGHWPGPNFVLSLDEPIYLSVHSAIAELAPPEHTLVSLVWYRRDDEPLSAKQLRERLERFARRWLPSLESRLVVDQFLPNITVAHDRAQARRGGLPGRTPPSLGQGLHLVGDWVGDRGSLLDASMASAASVSAAILGAARRSSGASPAHLGSSSHAH